MLEINFENEVTPPNSVGLEFEFEVASVENGAIYQAPSATREESIVKVVINVGGGR